MLESAHISGSICHTFLITSLILLGVMLVAGMIRLALGPKAPDRILAVNMTGGISVPVISILGLLLDEAWLLDVALIYALLSFLAVVILSQVFIQEHKRKHSQNKKIGV